MKDVFIELNYCWDFNNEYVFAFLYMEDIVADNIEHNIGDY